MIQKFEIVQTVFKGQNYAPLMQKKVVGVCIKAKVECAMQKGVCVKLLGNIILVLSLILKCLFIFACLTIYETTFSIKKLFKLYVPSKEVYFLIFHFLLKKLDSFSFFGWILYKKGLFKIKKESN